MVARGWRVGIKSFGLTGIEFQFCKMNSILEMVVMVPRRVLNATEPQTLQCLKWKISLCVFYRNKKILTAATLPLKCRDIQIR